MQNGFGKTALTLATGLLLTLPLVACMPKTNGSATEMAICDQFKPIRWSASDTPGTVAQIKPHNAAGEAVCGWRP